MRLLTTTVLFALSGCYVSLGSSLRSTNELTLGNDGLLCGDRSATLSITASDPSYFLHDGKLETPNVSLVQGETDTDIPAVWNSDNKSLLVSVPAGLSEGTYNLALRRPHDQALTVLDNAVTVTAPPTVSHALGQAACTSGTSTSELRLFGTHLTGAKVRLAGLTLQLEASADDGGEQLTVTLPAQLPAGGPYDVVIETGIGCTAVLSPGVSLVSAPVVTTLAFGPQLLTLDSASEPVVTGSVPRSTQVTVRVAGNNLIAGTRVFVGETEADTVMPTTGAVAGSSIDATFAPGRLSVGTQTTLLKNGGCGVSSGDVQVENTSLSIERTNPTVVSSAAGRQFLDVYGAFAAAGARIRFYVDTDPDPIAVHYEALSHFDWLDSAHTAARTEIARELSASEKRYDIVAIGVGARGLQQGVLSVSNLAVPSVVTKNKTNLIGSRMGGDDLSVLGCDFDAKTNWSLMTPAGSETTLPAPSLHTLTSGDWGYKRYRCTHNRYADTRADFTALAPAPGVYRLRAAIAAGTVDDLYPLVVYGDAPQLDAAVDAHVATATPRREARAVRATDASGRSYVYVIGGSNVAAAAASKVGTIEATTEFAPLDFSHRLQPGDAGAFGRVAPSPLEVLATVGDKYAVDPLGGGYAPAVLADGSTIYFIGGETGAGSSDGVFYTRLADPTDRPRIVELTPGAGGDLAAGDYWVAFAQKTGRFDSVAPAIETTLSQPVRFSSAANGSVSARVATHCGFSTDTGEDPGYPALGLYLAPVTSDGLEPDALAYHRAFVAAAPADAPCIAGQPLTYDLVISTFATSGASPPVLGTLPAFRTTSVALANPVYGAGAAFIVSGPTRQIMVVGGEDDDQRINFLTLDGEGVPTAAGSNNSLPAAHSFGAAFTSPLNAGLVITSGGYSQREASYACVETPQSYSVAVGAPGISLLSDGAVTIGSAYVLLGRSLVALGGATFNCHTAQPDTVTFNKNIMSRRIDNADAFSKQDGTLLLPVGSAAAVAAPPYIYLIGGVTGLADGQVGDVNLINGTAEILTNP